MGTKLDKIENLRSGVHVGAVDRACLVVHALQRGTPAQLGNWEACSSASESHSPAFEQHIADADVVPPGYGVVERSTLPLVYRWQGRVRSARSSWIRVTCRRSAVSQPSICSAQGASCSSLGSGPPGLSSAASM